MLTVVVERRSIALKLRRMKWFRTSALFALAGSLFGLGTTIVGVQLEGLETWWAGAAWAAAITSIVPLALTLMGVMATNEVEEDEPLEATGPVA
jgi:hypothetical protein